MIELTIAVIRADGSDNVLKWQSLSSKDRRIEVAAIDKGSLLCDVINNSCGRYIKIAGPYDEPVPEKITKLVDIIEASDVEGMIAGYRTEDENGQGTDHIPESASAGRRIDLIKLLDKYKDAADCLNYHCIIYNTGFLKECGADLWGTNEFELSAYALKPFIFLDSVMMVPEVVSVQKASKAVQPEVGAVKTIRDIIDTYIRNKPMGRARDEFIRKRIEVLVTDMYEYLILKSGGSPKARHDAFQLNEFIKNRDARLYKTTERAYKKLVRISRYKTLTKLYGHLHKW